MIHAILFDFNGVIIDDERVQMKAYMDVLSEKGIELSEEDYFSCLGMNDVAFVTNAYKKAGKELEASEIGPIVEAKTAKWKVEVDKHLPLFDGAKDFVARMAESFSIGIVSMARRPEIDHILGEADIADYFSMIVSAEDINTFKPDPECYKVGFSKLDRVHTANGNNPLSRKHCVVIEDSPPGIVSAKGAGLKALGVTNTVGDDELRQAGADSVTGNLSDWNAESFRRVF